MKGIIKAKEQEMKSIFKLPTVSASRTLPTNFKLDLQALTDFDQQQKQASQAEENKGFMFKTFRMLTERDLEHDHL